MVIKMNENRKNRGKSPRVTMLRSASGEYIDPVPLPNDADINALTPETPWRAGQPVSAASLAAEAIEHTPVASANDCTGIAVTVPETESEAKAISSLEPIPVTPEKSGQER